MFHSAPSPRPSGPQSSPYGFATPVRTPSTSYHAYSQALTPASDASAKAVRFQNQPPSSQAQQQQQQQQQQQSQGAASASIATPNKSPYYNAVSTSTQPTQQQAVQRSVGASAGGAPVTNGTTTPTTNKMVAKGAAVLPTTAAGSESTIALKRRIKWNLSALGLLWILPAVSTRPRDVYWAVLDQIYLHVGGETDELVDGVVGWILWAISVVLLFNAVEATILVRRASATTSAPAPNTSVSSGATPQTANREQSRPGTVLGLQSPAIAKSINFVAASRLKGSPKTRTSNIGAGSPISRSSPRGSPRQDSPAGSAGIVDYSQFSPANRRTSSPISASNSSYNGFANGGSRMGTPTSVGVGEYGATVGANAGSSPLAAFRARHVSRGSASPSRARSLTPSVSNSGLGEFSFDGGEIEADEGGEATFLGDESFEVDRALKSLRSSLGGVSSTPAPAFR